jgi:oligo-1,6-glucosidase
MRSWWKEATVYQIYPRSFADSNGDGIGDLNGITSRLDYLKGLGVDVVWLCPVYKSPDVDNGYDISDYREISAKFGTMKDFDRLLTEVHKRGMKLIMDAVFNHTSDESKWFIESRKSKKSAYRNYYFWRKGKNGKEPNNWKSHFGGSAWQYDKNTGEYYLHIWDRKQPDLNWDNRKVRQEIYKVMKWWLDKGIDGFRFDVINFISKVPGLPDVPSKGKGYADGRKYYVNGPKMNAYLKEMNMQVLSRYDAMSVGETSARISEINIIKAYVDSKNHELDMVFHENNEIRSRKPHKASTLLESRYQNSVKWKLSDLKRIFTAWQKGLERDGWDSIYLGNHDYPRIVSRFGDEGRYRVESGKMLATMLFTLRGTPYIYQGEEIGMTNAGFKSIKDYRDVSTLNLYEEYVDTHGNGSAALKLLGNTSRDNARTPMQWDESRNAGFTSAEPWIKVNSNYRKINVSRALREKDSLLNYYKKLIELRKKNQVFVYGDYNIILQKHPHVYSYTRKLGSRMLLVVLNFAGRNTKLSLPKNMAYSKAQLVIGNYPVDGAKGMEKMKLRPYEARVYSLGA